MSEKDQFEEDDRLENLLYRAGCPSNLTLLAYIEDLLEEEMRQLIDRHLLICPHCLADIAELRQEKGVITQQEQKLSELPVEHKPFFPELILSPLSAIRSGDELRGVTRIEKTYHIEAIDWDILLSWQLSDGEHFSIQGQLLGVIELEYDQIEIELFETEGTEPILSKNGKLQMAGLFKFADVPIGTYAILIKSPTFEIPISDIKLII